MRQALTMLLACAIVVMTTPAFSQTGQGLPSFGPGKVVVINAATIRTVTGDSARIAFFTPTAFSALFKKPTGRNRSPDVIGQPAWLDTGQMHVDRTHIIRDQQRRFGRQVTVLMITVKASPANTDPVPLYPDYEFGIQRGQQEIRSLGLDRLIWVNPDGIGYSFIIFSKMKLETDDAVYIKFPEPK